ncbi:MAG TPA: hypothetical protein VKT80_08205, partial [Chloroflexota bacterium]|nr:hypothetical protein [Chloroflexota bacterium]
LHSSGVIDRFSDGKPAELLALPANLVPTGPAGLAVDSNSLYVGDPRHGRILQLGRRGDYQRVLQADDASLLRDMRDLALSDDGKYLYVLSGSSVLRYTIPKTP